MEATDEYTSFFTGDDGKSYKGVMWPTKFGGRSILVELIKVRNAKGEYVEDDECRELNIEALRDTRRTSLNLAGPEEIAEIRQKLGLSRAQASTLFCGGSKSFQKYESGKVLPSVAVSKLMRLVRKHPELMAEMT